MTRPASMRILLALCAAAAVFTTAACGAEEGSGTTTTEQATTTTTADEDTTTTEASAPPVGATETVGPYTLEVVDPSEFGLGPEQGLDVTAAKVTEDATVIGALLRFRADEYITFTEELSVQILSQVAQGATPQPITIDGKSGYVTENADGQVIIGRATEEGDLGVMIGAPAVSQDKLVDVLQTISS